jgi:hypothetical protein
VIGHQARHLYVAVLKTSFDKGSAGDKLLHQEKLALPGRQHWHTNGMSNIGHFMMF